VKTDQINSGIGLCFDDFMKRNVVLLFVFIFIGHIVWGQESIKNVIINGNLSVLSRTIETDELWDLTQSELRILRNTIYAKYGYIFRSVDLQAHFSKFPWYQAVNGNVDNYLSVTDKENIARIQRRENSLEEIISFQNTMLSWIQKKEIFLPLSNINFNGVALYQNPTLYSEMPERLLLDLGDMTVTLAFCFAMGRFLTPAESEKITQIGNFSNFKNAIIFSPSILFLNASIFSRVYRPFNDTGTFLIVLPYDGSSEYNIQANQILNNASKNILILPWSVHYFVYKITNDGKLELIGEVAAN
jgi:hypothetical protein